MDAAIDCLVEEGYAKTTTRRIAERAGVTPGALRHHFASKAELLGETTRHIAAKTAKEMLAQGIPSAPSIQLRHEELLDRMWEMYKGPLFQAALELAVAARTDPELREHRVGAQHETARWIESGAHILQPELADGPGFTELIATGQATMRGLALMGFGGDAELDEVWPATRAHLLALAAEVISKAER